MAHLKGKLKVKESSESILYIKKVPTPFGRKLCLICNDRAIRAVLWERKQIKEPALSQFHLKRVSSHPLLDQAEEQLDEYFEGKRKSFDLLLDPMGTPFQKNAWRVLSQIPYGEIISYQQQAERLGSKDKARAVGAANGRNPISIIIPCHRVVGKSGDLRGFAAGLKLKKQLLDLEARGSSVCHTF